MKKISFLFSALLLTSTCYLVQAQQTISLRGTPFTIAGKSAGSITGNGGPDNSYECFWKIDNGSKLLTCTTLQTIGKGDNNKDIVVKTVSLPALKIEFWDDEPDTDNNMFPQPVYKVVLQTKNYEKVINVQASYRFMDDAELAAQDNVYEILMVFKEKTDATDFIKQLNAFK